jgi:hypothetical protein
MSAFLRESLEVFQVSSSISRVLNTILYIYKRGSLLLLRNTLSVSRKMIIYISSIMMLLFLGRRKDSKTLRRSRATYLDK